MNDNADNDNDRNVDLEDFDGEWVVMLLQMIGLQECKMFL